MKKIIIAASAVLMAVACNSQTLEQKMEAYNEKNTAIYENYQKECESVQNDANLTDEQKAAKYEAAQDNAVEELLKLGKKTISKNADNELGVKALQDIYYMLEPEEVSALLKKFSPENRENDFVKRIAANLDAKIATGEGKMFTDFEIVQYPDAEDKGVVKLSDYVGKGKYVLVDFWASWCGPCKREIPNIKSVYEQFKGENFDVLSVAVWDDPKATADTAAAYGVNWNQIVNAQKIPSDLYGIEGIPHIILFGPDGTIVKRNLRGEKIAAEVAACLGR